MRTRPCTDDQLSALLDSVYGRDNRLAISVAAETGLRIDDVLSLPSAAQYRPVDIIEHKRGVHRVIDLSAGLRSQLQARRCGNTPYLFPGRCHGHRHRTTVYKAMRRACDGAGLPALSPHSLRKLYAQRLYRRTGDVDYVRRELGHKYISTTLIYLFLQ